MNRIRTRFGIVQNTGFFDRILRITVGIILLAGGMISLAIAETVSRQGYAMLLSLYPLVTGIIGWDPFYCFRCRDIDGRDRCGSLLSEAQSMRGLYNNPPEQDFDYEKNLDASHRV